MLQKDVIVREWTSDMFTMCYLTYRCQSVCPTCINSDSALATYKHITAPSNPLFNPSSQVIEIEVKRM